MIRGFGTAIMHGGTATILAMISITLYERRPTGGLQLLLPGFLAAVALHTGFNYLLVRPALATLATLLVLPLVIYLVFEHSERILRNWLDVDLESDVKLLRVDQHRHVPRQPLRPLPAVAARSLSRRGSGRHAVLAATARRTRPARQGHAAAARKRHASRRSTTETRDKLAELEQLERAIGKAGVLALRPLMMATGKDIWQLTLLRP